MAIDRREIERLQARRQEIDVQAKRKRLLEAVDQALEGELPPLWQAAAAVVPLRSGADRAPAAVPWASVNPKLKHQMPLRMPEKLHLQLLWLTERIPKASMHSIALAAVQREVERLVRELGGEP